MLALVVLLTTSTTAAPAPATLAGYTCVPAPNTTLARAPRPAPPGGVPLCPPGLVPQPVAHSEPHRPPPPAFGPHARVPAAPIVTGQEHFLYNSARENLGMTALDTAFPTGASAPW